VSRAALESAWVLQTLPAVKKRILGAMWVAAVGGAAIGAWSCGGGRESESTDAPSGAAAAEAPSEAPTRAKEAPPVSRIGASLVRTPQNDALVLADEDHDAIRRMRLPLDVNDTAGVTDLPGHPSQVVAMGERILVTLRDPGALVVMKLDQGRYVETARVALPADAWGLAVSEDLRTAVVTSAWTHHVTAVDLDSLEVRWSVDVGREPRGVAVTPDGVVYVDHLVGRFLTRIDGVDQQAPKAERVDLAPAPIRARHGQTLDASLGYSLVLSPDANKLYVPRHAIGAQGETWWTGVSTVDVLSTKTDAPLAIPKATNALSTNPNIGSMTQMLRDSDGMVPLSDPSFVQPRAAVYRSSTDSILVAGEGTNNLAELDARSNDPALHPLRTYGLAITDPSESPKVAPIHRTGGAPSAIALSADEMQAYVFCRTTNDIMVVDLDRHDPDLPFKPTPNAFVHFAEDTLSPDAAKGRRLFYDATDRVVSGGFACAGCHPDGRDDGHVWHEIDTDNFFTNGFRGEGVVGAVDASGHARQTPMLAGRLDAPGPYGWQGESKDLESRLRVGFAMHQWAGTKSNAEYIVGLDRPKALVAFAREGLVPPPATPHEPTEQEKLGEAVFNREDTACATCHAAEKGFTDRSIVALGRPTRPGFDDETAAGFKTPSLLYVGGTPPYYHDGAESSLDALVLHNGSTMGKTSQLGSTEKAALVAYLQTIGGFTTPPAELPKRAPGVAFASGDGAPSVEGGPTVDLERKPSSAEWKDVPVAATAKNGACTLKRKGSWAQLACPDFTGQAMDVLGGKPRKMSLWQDENRGTSVIVFPIQKGEQLLVQIETMEFGGGWGDSAFLTQGGLLEVDWRGGDEPLILF
jgi:cytochrome c peroxidase